MDKVRDRGLSGGKGEIFGVWVDFVGKLQMSPRLSFKNQF